MTEVILGLVEKEEHRPELVESMQCNPLRSQEGWAKNIVVNDRMQDEMRIHTSVGRLSGGFPPLPAPVSCCMPKHPHRHFRGNGFFP